MNFLQTLVNFSERAARIAKIIRQDPRLFALLVEEKGELEKNKRFSQDFKTLADVLIQESLRYYVAAKFPNLAQHVKGEENASFTNTLGEKIDVCVCQSQNDTATLLAKVLNGNVEAANILAEVVHGKIEDVDVREDLKAKFPTIKLENIGIWIDPIDSTSEYIHGNLGSLEPSTQVYHCGLPCVTVLLGVYDRFSGRPIAGIINQPFAEREASSMRWMSRIYWGVNYASVLLHSLPLPSVSECSDQPFIVISNSECASLQNELKKQFGVIHATGAGYKGLVVALGLVEAYFCSKSLSVDELEKHQITYHEGNEELSSSQGSQMWCNKDGVVVYRNPEILTKVYESLKNM